MGPVPVSADPAPTFPRYDPNGPIHIGTVIEDDDEPECHGYCHDTCCQPYAPCTCEDAGCEECKTERTKP